MPSESMNVAQRSAQHHNFGKSSIDPQTELEKLKAAYQSLLFQFDIALVQNKSLKENQQNHDEVVNSYREKLLKAKKDNEQLVRDLQREISKRNSLNTRYQSKAQKYFKELRAKPGFKLANAIALRDAVLSDVGISVTELKSKCRKRPLPLARMLCSYFISIYSDTPFKEAAKMIFNNNDHTMISRSRDTVIERIEFDSEMKEQVERISKKLGL